MIGGGLRARVPQYETIEQAPPASAVQAQRPAAHAPDKPRRVSTVELRLLCIVVGAVLFYGWLQSDEGHLTAETGLGYYLGIAGSLLMLVLLLYPLRKRMRALRFIGNVKIWFRVHVLLGVVGPALILLHSNFTVASFNGTVALIFMLTVVGSGFVGRFLYARVHRRLYGRKAHAREFVSDAGDFKAALYADGSGASGILQTLQAYEARHLDQTPGLAVGMWRTLTSGSRGRRARKFIMSEIRTMIDQRAAQEGWTKSARRRRLSAYRRHFDSYFDAVARAEAFALYERLFSLWHMLHLPLFAILILAALAHVVAVHLY